MAQLRRYMPEGDVTAKVKLKARGNRQGEVKRKYRQKEVQRSYKQGDEII